MIERPDRLVLTGKKTVMSIQREPTFIAAAPALLLYCGDAHKASKVGTILFYHGFGGSKEDYLPELTALAEAGFLAIGLDNVGHGERRLPDFEARVGSQPPGPDLEAALLTLVRATAQEVPKVVDTLIGRDLATPEHVGIAGWSMGGFIAYAAVVADPRLRVAVPIVGSPEWRLPWPDSPHRYPERFFPVALLSQTAHDDVRVSPHFARTFHQLLEPYYASAPKRLCYIEYKNADHAVTAMVRQKMQQKMVDWFKHHLNTMAVP